MSRVAIPTPLPLLAAPEPHPCVSRACAFWQVGHFFARSGAEDHPPNRLRLAADPQRARRRLPLDHIHSPPLSNLPQPPIHPSTPPPTLQSTPPHLSRIPPPTARPPCARSCNFSPVWCCSLFGLYNTLVCHLSNVWVRCGACSDASRPKTLGAPRGAHGRASRHSPRACRRAPAPSDWSCSQLRYSSVRESNDQAPASVSIAFERWPVGAHRARRGRRGTTAPCLASESVWSDSNGLSDRDIILSRCKLLKSVAGSVHVHRYAPARPWDALNIQDEHQIARAPR